MNTDSYYEIGHSHTICEDYAISGKINEHLVYAIVSDGCSASPAVDVGARILAHAAKEYFCTRYSDSECLGNADSKVVGVSIVNIAAQHAKMLSLPLGALDCTLLIVLWSKTDSHVFIYGDGCCMVKRYNGDIWYHTVEFPSGAPLYLSYALSPEREKLYNVEYGRELEAKWFLYKSEEDEWTLMDRSAQPETALSTYCPFPREEMECVMVASDGIKTYENPDNEELPIKYIVKEFTAYKQYKGQFVERRMKKLRKDFRKLGIDHYDDVSIAAIHTQDEA